MIRSFGLEGDMVADTRHHGGPDMAVHHYPHDHYSAWAEWLGGHDLLSGPAAFGENIEATGLVETDVRIGDRFRLGEALLEVSQPRKPCWKIEHRFGRKGMVAHIVKTHISGWYYRVIEEGIAQAGDHLTKVDDGKTDWTVARLFAALYDPACKPAPDQLEEICMLEKLSEEVRLSLSRKL